MAKLPVAILGCTGAVGQKFVALLADHPWFEVRQLSASTERIGLRYGDTVRWREPTPIPPRVADLVLSATAPAVGIRIAFSALDAPVAREVEPAFAAAGVMVVSNASAFRMAADVPLLIPEVNPGHLSLLDSQRKGRGWSGGIVANPNCSTAALVTALAPIHRSHGIETAVAATLQAASGAGYPGVPSLDLIDNVIPFIGGEEEKIESECRKLLGDAEADGVTDATLTVSSMVHRVPVLDGHMVSVSLKLRTPASPEQVIESLESFRGDETVAALPSSPARPVEVDRRDDRPQPRLDRDRGSGMAVTVGRVRPCPVNTVRFTVLGHNLIRGAAGAAVQNAELIVSSGRIS